MSISKLLMTAAVCAISMAAVSTSYGSGHGGAFASDIDEGFHEESAAAATKLGKFVGGGRPPRDLDSMSQVSRSSTATLITKDTLERLSALLKKEVPLSVAYPDSNALKGKKPVEVLEIGYTNLVTAYNGIVIAAAAEISLAQQARVADFAEIHSTLVTKVDKSTVVTKVAILDAIAEEKARLNQAILETRKWKAISGGVVSIAVVLLGIIVKNWSTLFGK